MLYFVEGNILESPAQTLVNTVNTAGAMGKGLAKEFKRLFPDMFKQYQLLCESRQLKVGRVWLYRTPNKWVLNFPTKQHWRHPSKIEYVKAGLEAFRQLYAKAGITSIAFPQLGCGNGELDWSEVRSVMTDFLDKLPIDIFIYESNKVNQPEHRDINGMRQWLMTEPASYPFDEFKRDLRGAISQADTCSDTTGAPFQVSVSETGTHIKRGPEEFDLAWEGDELSSGWLQVWQLIREKGMCTLHQLSELGIIGCESYVLCLLLSLPYVGHFRVWVGGHPVEAAMIRPMTRQPTLGLFAETHRPSIRL